jgi:hypothetical protein
MTMKFGHHYQPGWDFVIEVNTIAGLAADPAADRVALRERVARAMDFRVGGLPESISAKATLRLIEKRLDDTPRIAPESEKLVLDFAAALRAKLAAAEAKYGWNDNWKFDDWEEDCRAQMRRHIAKGDPLDVAAFCAFLWGRGWSSAEPADATVDRAAAMKIAAAGDKVLRDLHDMVMTEQTGSRWMMAAAEAAIMEIVRLRGAAPVVVPDVAQAAE